MGFWEKLDPSRYWNRAAKGAGRNMAEGARQEFEKAMDNLFNNKVNPLMSNIDYIASQRIKQTEGVITTAINNVAILKNEFKGDIESILNNADDRYKENLKLTFDEINQARAEAIFELREVIGEVDQSLENRINQTAVVLMSALAKAQEISDNFRPGAFQTQLVEPTFAKLNQLEQKVYQDADQLLDKFFLGANTNIEEVRRKVLKAFTPVDKKSGYTRKGLLKFIPLLGMNLNDVELYRYSTWLEMKKISEVIEQKTSVDKIIDSYIQLQINAVRMHFIAKSMAIQALQNECIVDFIKYGQAIQLYGSYANRQLSYGDLKQLVQKD